MARERPVVHLHIGAMKTGTTYLQQLMAANADAMHAAGYLFPLVDGRYSQTLATRDVLDMRGDPVTLAKSRGEWDRVTREMLSYDGDSVFSMEFLTFARKQLAGKVVRSLDGADVRAILTVRDGASALPAQWQQGMQSQRTTPWGDFLAEIMADPRDYDTWSAKAYRRAQDIPRMLDAWLPHVPAEHFTVVTLPRPGSRRNLLWERFAEAIGIDPGTAKRPAPEVNESIGAASAELLRRLNKGLDDVRIADYRGTMRHTLATRILSDRAKTEGKAPTSTRFREFAAAENARTREAISSTGVRVIGDLEDLPVVPGPAPEGEPAETVPSPHDSEVVTAAAYALPRLRDILESRARKLDNTTKRDARDRMAAVPSDDETAALTRWNTAADPVGAAVEDLAIICRVGIEIGIRLRQEPTETESAPPDAARH